MATDEQMAVALLALGAVAIYAMNNSTESVPPARRKENQQNALRATIHTWCANAKTHVSKIAVRSMSRGGDEIGVPDRTEDAGHPPFSEARASASWKPGSGLPEG